MGNEIRPGRSGGAVQPEPHRGPRLLQSILSALHPLQPLKDRLILCLDSRTQHLLKLLHVFQRPAVPMRHQFHIHTPVPAPNAEGICLAVFVLACMALLFTQIVCLFLMNGPTSVWVYDFVIPKAGVVAAVMVIAVVLLSYLRPEKQADS